MPLSSPHVVHSSYPGRQLSLKLMGFILLFLCAIIAHSNHALADKEDKCTFSRYKDEKVLEKEKEKLKPLVGKTYSSAIVNSTYTYHIGICTSPDMDKQDAAVTQQKMKDGKPDGEPVVIGSLKNTHIMTGTKWILLEYGDGGKYHTHCNGEPKSTVLMLICDETADENNPEMIFIKEENSKTEKCHYLFEMSHKAVCPIVSSSGGLSVGSILVIVFVCVVGVYLIVGFLYTRFTLGAKGVEQIPNYEFWKDFGNLQADGCDLVCRTKERRRAGGFGGIGDDMLDPAEEVRDDNLLPM